jgi:hypothetical protein
VANTTGLASGRPGFETYLAGAEFDDWVAGPPADRIEAVVTPGSAISTVTPCVAVPVIVTRTDPTPAIGYSVTFELSSNLSLCGAQIQSGGYPLEPRQLQVIPLGSNQWTVDEVTLGTPCGASGSGTLFTIDVTSADPTGSGSITILSTTVRDCDNQPILSAPGAPASIVIDRVGPERTTDLVSTPSLSGNYVPSPSHATTSIRLDFTQPADATNVEIYRRPFGGYPQYDENGGEAPLAPSSLPAAGWTLIGATTSGQSDEPMTRDFWHYALVTRDAYGNPSEVSNMTPGALNYHLGDVSDGVSACAGDDHVDTADLSLLGSHYGATLPVNDPLECIDFGPTSDHTPAGRPLTDNLLAFEDLVIIALNYDLVSVPQSRAAPAGGGLERVSLTAPHHVDAGSEFEARVDLSAGGRLHALSVALDWDRSVARAEGVRSGGLLERSGGVTFAAGPAALDGAVLGAGSPGVTGDGTFALVRFVALGSGDPRVRVLRADGRDERNDPVALDGSLTAPPSTAGSETRLLPATPAPFSSRTTIAFSLAADAEVELAVFAIDGRRVRTLVRGLQSAGLHSVQWDGTDDRGRAVAAGLYYARLGVGSRRWTNTIVKLAR